MRNLFLYSIGLAAVIATSACAQTRKQQSARGGTPQIIEATVQRTLFGRAESAPRTDYRIVLIWKGNTPPSVFYWRPDATTWRDVSVAKPERRPGLGPNDFMVFERNIKYADMRSGDKIIVTPHSHNDMEDDMPAAVKKMPSSSLYYKIGNQWKHVPVKPVRRPDIALP